MSLFVPTIAKSVTTDTNGLFIEPSSTYGRLLTPLTDPLQAPVRPVVALKPVGKTIEPPKPTGDVLSRIAWCESRGKLHARNPKSTAKGKYQFLNGSWKYYGEKYWGSLEGKDVFSEKDQDDLARYVVSVRGYADWEASRHCWG